MLPKSVPLSYPIQRGHYRTGSPTRVGLTSAARPKGKPLQKAFRTEAAAQAWERDALARLKAGRMPPGHEQPQTASQMTLGDLSELTYDRYWKHARAEKALGINARAVRDGVGTYRVVSQINETDIA